MFHIPVWSEETERYSFVNTHFAQTFSKALVSRMVMTGGSSTVTSNVGRTETDGVILPSFYYSIM